MADTSIEVRLNGPLRVRGPFDLVDQQGRHFKLAEGEWVSLCRCGESSNKPFCDSTHRKIEFKAETTAEGREA